MPCPHSRVAAAASPPIGIATRSQVTTSCRMRSARGRAGALTSGKGEMPSYSTADAAVDVGDGYGAAAVGVGCGRAGAELTEDGVSRSIADLAGGTWQRGGSRDRRLV